MKLLRQLRAFCRKDKLDAEMSEELRAHLELLAEENEKRGMTTADARYAAYRQFGGVEQIKERARDERGFRWLEQLGQDLRYGARMLRKNPGFTAVAVLSLGLGIGVSVVTFSLVNAAAFRPLPGVKDPARLVYRNASRGGGISYPEYEYFREHTQVFSGLAASLQLRSAIALVDPAGSRSDPGAPAEYLRNVWLVSGNYFPVLGAELELGRAFLPEEDGAAAAHPVLILSHEFWAGRFNSDPQIVGKTLLLNQVAFTVIGVARRDFALEPGRFESPWAWAPIAMQSGLERGHDRLHSHDEIEFMFFGRLRPEATFAQAVAELGVLDAQYAARFLPPDPQRIARAARVDDSFVFLPWRMPEVKATMIGFLLVASVVLLVACANLASLLLARATTRQREISVRLALGASRGRVVRQLLTESTMIACLGGGAGLLLAAQVSERVWPPLLRLSLTPELRHLFSVDARIVAYAAAVSLITGVLFGLMPALEAARASTHASLKQEHAVLGQRVSRARLRNFLVIAQVAVCVSLLIAATLVVRSTAWRGAPDLAFAMDGVYFATSSAPAGSNAARHPREFERALGDRLRQLPEARAVAVAEIWDTREVDVAPVSDAAGSPRDVHRRVRQGLVEPDYFSALELRLVRGRNFTADEVASDADVVIISETLAQQLWPGGDPLGRHVELVDPEVAHLNAGGGARAREVIGIVQDGVGAVRSRWGNGAFPGDLYSPLPPNHARFAEIWVRAAGNLEHFLRTAQEQARLVNPDVQVGFTGQLSYFLAAWRQRMLTLSGSVAVLGALALLLAALGVYGVMAYAVAQRTHEIGVRMALGAERATIQRMVLREGVGLVAWGVALGALGCAGVSWLARSLLYGLSPFDPLTFGGISLVLGAVALAACWFPARAATKVDPMVALRCD
jgi:predicted permease